MSGWDPDRGRDSTDRPLNLHAGRGGDDSHLFDNPEGLPCSGCLEWPCECKAVRSRPYVVEGGKRRPVVDIDMGDDAA